MNSYITGSIGPAIIIGHTRPHFSAAGDCICSCKSCARSAPDDPLAICGVCICPDCPCTQDGVKAGAP